MMVIKFWTLLRKWQQMTIKVCGDDAKAQTIGLPGKYMACAFFIDREELKKYL